MRKPRGPTTKTFGYIVVPVFAGMSDNDTLEEAIKSERFKQLLMFSTRFKSTMRNLSILSVRLGSGRGPVNHSIQGG